MRIARFSPLLVMLLASGCANVTKIPTDVATPGMPNVDLAIDRGVAEVNRAMNEVGTMGDRQPTVAGSPAPGPLQRPVLFGMTGPLDVAAKALAEHAGYSFTSNATPTTQQVSVTLPGTAAPMIDLLRSLGQQAGNQADVVVNTQARRIEVRYHA